MAAPSFPKRADTTKGPPLRILSLDGGGVRGYSMLILLQELMHRTYVEIHGNAPKREEIPKPCDHFDLIVGTGTGGLIAIMLGRLRMDIAKCMDVYVRMTKRVFETDKTFAGVPFKTTLFKASKLEQAIQDCVREHTVYDDEGNDNLMTGQSVMSPISPMTPASAFSPDDPPQRAMSTVSRQSKSSSRPPTGSRRPGNPNALLYDVRENRAKTAVTAIYKNSPRNGPAALLRSYDSRKEPAPETNCTIWQAGRATAATRLAFKPIQIGQSVYVDEGGGKFNPSPQALDEATINEWPGRDVGVFVSIGTGKRPRGSDNMQHQWWESFVGGSIGDFAEGRKNLMAKIEGCEDIHNYMMKEHLGKRQVNAENYYRLNVEVGVGEFGMNEWNRLSDISSNTRMYLGRTEVQNMNLTAAAKLSKIHKAKIRWERGMRNDFAHNRNSWETDAEPPSFADVPPPSNPMAVELQGSDERYSTDSRPISSVQPQYHASTPPKPSSPRNSHPPFQQPPAYPLHHSFQHKNSDLDKYPIAVSPDDPPQPVHHQTTQPQKRPSSPHSRPSMDNRPPTPQAPPSRPSAEYAPHYAGAPPRPPKTPIGVRPIGTLSRPPAGVVLPYPDADGPPPPVNMARKPEYGVR